MTRALCFAFLSWGLLAFSSQPVLAQKPDGTSSPSGVSQIRQERPAFLVRASVDRKDRMYEEGETMTIDVVSEKSGYLYLLYEFADGKISCVFPNKYQTDNRISSKKKLQVPVADAEWELKIGQPLGKETLKAIVSLNLVPAEKFKVRTLIPAEGQPFVELPPDVAKGLYPTLKKKLVQWAEHHVSITTVPQGQRAIALATRDDEKTDAEEQPQPAPLKPDQTPKPPTAEPAKPEPAKPEPAKPQPAESTQSEKPQPRRIALIVALSKYQDSRIPRLTSPDKDGKKMADILARYGQVDEVIVLINEKATLKNVRHAICKTLVEKTRPGDEVVIYISGHGCRLSDDSGDEEDGYDEAIALFDSRLDNMDTVRRTMVSDDEFGRWIQDLDGRRVAIILDICHAAGMAAGQKGISEFYAIPKQPFDFLASELTRAKDIGQEEVALLCASRSDQKAFERRQRDLSAMTYYLVESIEGANSPVTIAAAYEDVKVKVPQYIQSTFGVQAQTPVFVSSLTEDLFLRP